MAIRIVNKAGVADTQIELLDSTYTIDDTYVYCIDTQNTYVWDGGVWTLFNNELFYIKNPPPEDEAKQDVLVSGTNIKTINGSTILGSGDLVVSGSDATKLAILNNLSDLNNAATARTNLGLDTTANQTDSTDKRFMSDAQETKLDAVVLPTGTPDGTKYLRDDNTWQAVSGGSGLAQYQVRQLIRR